MADGPVIALIDGEHHPPAVRDTLDRLHAARGVAGVVFCGGEEKVSAAALADPVAHYGRDVVTGSRRTRPRDGSRAHRGALGAAGAPAAPCSTWRTSRCSTRTARLRLAALALHLGLAYERRACGLTPPPYASVPFDGRTLAVIGTGKRSGKTAVAGHWAEPAPRGRRRAGDRVHGSRRAARRHRSRAPASGSRTCSRISDAGAHAASDYLEGAALAGVTTVGCRRVGGGLGGEPGESNMAEATRLAAGIASGRSDPRGLGIMHPAGGRRPDGLRGRLAVDRRARPLPRAARRPLPDVSRRSTAPGPSLRFDLRPEPAEPMPRRTPGWPRSPRAAERCEGVEPVVSSRNLSRRAAPSPRTSTGPWPRAATSTSRS